MTPQEPSSPARTSLWGRMTAHGAAVFVSVAVMLAIGVVALLPALVVSYTSSVGEPVRDLSYGTDLRAFTGAGELALDRDAENLYNQDHPVYVDSGASRFVNPPWYAIAMIPISWIPFSVLWPLWAVAGIVALWFGVRALDLALADRWVVGSLLTLAGALTIFYGQNSFLMAALLACAVIALLRGPAPLAGSAFALLAFKPHLLLGFVVWWLIELRTRWKVVVWAATGTVVLAALAALWLPGVWPEFFEMLTTGDDLVIPEREVSLVSAVRLLAGDDVRLVASLAGLAIVGVISVLIIGIRQTNGDVRMASALAIVASLLIAPRALAYDWMLLLIAAALLVGLGLLRTATIVGWCAALGSVLSVGVVLIDVQMDAWGRALSIAPLALLLAFILLVSRMGSWVPPRGVEAKSP
ncbi:MAG: glycosyltransferase family 87 protein [Acidimicrobiia bacterium]